MEIVRSHVDIAQRQHVHGCGSDIDNAILVLKCSLWKNPKTDRWERTFAILTGVPNELVAPIHDRMTTFVEPRDYEEYLAPADRPPVHLLRVLPAQKMRVERVDDSPITNAQVNLFDSQ
jgi:putative SOS response-associated peptidase YedK